MVVAGVGSVDEAVRAVVPILLVPVLVPMASRTRRRRHRCMVLFRRRRALMRRVEGVVDGVGEAVVGLVEGAVRGGVEVGAARSNSSSSRRRLRRRPGVRGSGDVRATDASSLGVEDMERIHYPDLPHEMVE